MRCRNLQFAHRGRLWRSLWWWELLGSRQRAASTDPVGPRWAARLRTYGSGVININSNQLKSFTLQTMITISEKSPRKRFELWLLLWGNSVFARSSLRSVALAHKKHQDGIKNQDFQLTIHLHSDCPCFGRVDLIVFGHAWYLLVVHFSAQPKKTNFLVGLKYNLFTV